MPRRPLASGPARRVSASRRRLIRHTPLLRSALRRWPRRPHLPAAGTTGTLPLHVARLTARVWATPSPRQPTVCPPPPPPADVPRGPRASSPPSSAATPASHPPRAGGTRPPPPPWNASH
eukprot:scaffold238798_cov26-Tisochrysis_lutea.AAC.2